MSDAKLIKRLRDACRGGDECKCSLSEAADLITALLAQNAALRRERDELERKVPRFPDHMARIVEAKNAGLPERLQALVAALEAIPDHMRQYQWVADQKQAFGSKWVRAICGDNGKGMGRQAIAEVEGHIDVADFIAAANPDTVALMLAQIATLTAQVEGLTGALERIKADDQHQSEWRYWEKEDGYFAKIARAALTETATTEEGK